MIKSVPLTTILTFLCIFDNVVQCILHFVSITHERNEVDLAAIFSKLDDCEEALPNLILIVIIVGVV